MRSQLQILLAFDRAPGSLGASDVVARTGLPRSTVFRSLRTLVEGAFLIQTSRDGTSRYMLGPRILQLGLAARANLCSQELIAGPALDLARETGETVTFSIADVPWRLCTFVIDSPSSVRAVTTLGARYPLHLGAAGKALLANLGPSSITAVLKDADVGREQIPSLLSQLDDIRRDGYAISVGERVPDVAAVAAPVFASGHLLGCVAVAGPEERMSRRIPEHRDAVVRTAHHIADQMG